MKQILQDLKSGKTWLEEMPVPEPQQEEVLIKTSYSLVSLGTERMLIDFGKAGWIEKARQQPEKVKMVLDKVRTDGLKLTYEAVKNKLDQPIPLGYCNAGEVVAIGQGVTEFSIGDRVISNGPHAEYVRVPKNLVALIPNEVSDKEAAFTVIGSIGLQGIRLVNPSFGETIVVIGLGLIGLITVQLLRANGCRVLAYDLDKRKVELARTFGVEAFLAGSSFNPVDYVTSVTDGVGADAVLITASANTDRIISDAAKMTRKRGRIVLVGVVGLNITRSDFYEKELTFQVSSSYGPGRYDPEYETKGHDYPKAFVPWTVKRNFQAILEAIRKGELKVDPLITETCDLKDFDQIYGKMNNPDSIASLLKYESSSVPERRIQVYPDKTFEPKNPVIGIIGAGNFTTMTLLPILKKLDSQIKAISGASGLHSKILAKKYHIPVCTTDHHEILNDQEINLVLITTRHNLHATLTIESLNAGKHIFVEKPLALNLQELESVKARYLNEQNSLNVGFNRRFSPHSQLVKSYIDHKDPVNITATVNAGFIPKESWVQDPDLGGGRIIGEACHFFDLMIFLTGSIITSVCMNALGKNPDKYSDNASILIKFENGSQGVINYFSNGARSYSKERIEVYSRNRTLIIDNFKRTLGFGVKGFKNLKTKVDKGHKEQFKQLLKSIESGNGSIIPFEELINSSRSSLAALESLIKREWIEL